MFYILCMCDTVCVCVGVLCECACVLVYESVCSCVCVLVFYDSLAAAIIYIYIYLFIMCEMKWGLTYCGFFSYLLLAVWRVIFLDFVMLIWFKGWNISFQQITDIKIYLYTLFYVVVKVLIHWNATKGRCPIAIWLQYQTTC